MTEREKLMLEVLYYLISIRYWGVDYDEEIWDLKGRLEKELDNL